MHLDNVSHDAFLCSPFILRRTGGMFPGEGGRRGEDMHAPKMRSWCRVVDEAGREYWWNEHTDKVTWTNPHLLSTRLTTCLSIGVDSLTRRALRRWHAHSCSTSPHSRHSSLIRALDSWMSTRDSRTRSVARELRLADQVRDLTSSLVDAKLRLAEVLTLATAPRSPCPSPAPPSGRHASGACPHGCSPALAPPPTPTTRRGTRTWGRWHPHGTS